jgi:hypothetical protein
MTIELARYSCCCAAADRYGAVHTLAKEILEFQVALLFVGAFLDQSNDIFDQRSRISIGSATTPPKHH